MASATNNLSDMPIIYDTMTDEELMQFGTIDCQESIITSVTKQINKNDAFELNDDYSRISYNLDDILKIPDFLQYTENKIFERMAQEKIFHMKNTINLEQLGDIAILFYQINVLNLEHSLWNIYLKAGTGNLNIKESSLNLKDWPLPIKKMFQLYQIEKDTTTTTITSHNDMIDDGIIAIYNNNDYMQFIMQHLNEINTKQQELQHQLNLKKEKFNGYSSTIENALKTFLLKHMENLQLKYKCRMELVSFDCRKQYLNRTILQQMPTEQQLKLIRELYNLKCNYELAKHDVLFYKQSNLINSIQILLPSSIQSLKNIDQRLQLIDQHQDIVKNYKSEMSILFYNILEMKLEESKKLFEDEIKKMWHDEHQKPLHKRMNTIIIDYIDKYLILATEKFQCINDYKIQCYNFEQSK